MQPVSCASLKPAVTFYAFFGLIGAEIPRISSCSPENRRIRRVNIGTLQRGGYCRTKKVVGNQTADQSGFVIGVLHDTPPLDVDVKQTGV